MYKQSHNFELLFMVQEITIAYKMLLSTAMASEKSARNAARTQSHKPKTPWILNRYSHNQTVRNVGGGGGGGGGGGSK